VDECCTVAAIGVCDANMCGGGFHYKHVASTPACTGATCARAECCDENQSCEANFNCGAGNALRNRTAPCAGATCTSFECCVEKDACRANICPTGKVRNSFDAACSSTECTVTKCCETPPDAGDDGDIASWNWSTIDTYDLFNNDDNDPNASNCTGDLCGAFGQCIAIAISGTQTCAVMAGKYVTGNPTCNVWPMK
jgi:hypothetical protein